MLPQLKKNNLSRQKSRTDREALNTDADEKIMKVQEIQGFHES